MKIDTKWIKNHTNNMEVELIEIAKLICNHWSRCHSPDLNLMESMMFGFTQPVLIDENMNIIAGALRVHAAQDLDMSQAPCITIRGLSEAQKRACGMADLYWKREGEWDEEALRDVLETHEADAAREAVLLPYLEARKNLLLWLHSLDPAARPEALRNLEFNYRWNGGALVYGLDAVLAVMDYRDSIDHLNMEKDFVDTAYEEQHGEIDEENHERFDRTASPEEIAAEMEVEKRKNIAVELLIKLGEMHWENSIREGFLGVGMDETKKNLLSACWKQYAQKNLGVRNE